MPSGPPWHSERDALRVTFDEDARAYDRSRPVAPSYVFDDVVDLAGLQPGSAVVEVGPGTGQATRPLAERGLRVLALEIGPQLAARARENLAAFADVEVATPWVIPDDADQFWWVVEVDYDTGGVDG